MSDATRRAALAERAARAGGVSARETFRSAMAVETKADKTDVVTAADHDTQRQVIATIRQEFPDADFLCEEDATPVDDDVTLLAGVPESGDAWIVDPIDGTNNYVRGIRFWAVSIAAVVNGSAVGVATYLPAEGDIYTAGPESVTRNDATMAVSDRHDPEGFTIGLIGWWPARSGERQGALCRAAAERFGDVRRFGSLQGVLALVAAGSLDAAFMPETPHPWDSVAGVHLIRRAGGRVTDVDGNDWEHDSEGLVVSNGHCHDDVLAVVAGAMNVEAAD